MKPGGIMHVLGANLRPALVCVTAVMTLVAGTPHVDCRCPDGRRKPYCLGTTTSGRSCCCGGTCCPNTSGKGCCCGKQQDNSPASEGGRADKHPTQPAGPAPHVGRANCAKSAAEAVVGVAEERTRGSGDDTQPPPQAAAARPPCYAPVVAYRVAAWSVHDPGPPRDLVILLTHFLI